MKRLLLLFALVLPSAATAQEGEALTFDALTFGVSGVEAVEATYKTRLACGALSERVERCRAIGHVRRIEATFEDGRLRQLRMILPAGAIAEAVVADLRKRWGPVVHQDVGTGRAEGLRIWFYALPAEGLGVLEEVRSRVSGAQRLRLAVTDTRGDWLAELGSGSAYSVR